MTKTETLLRKEKKMEKNLKTIPFVAHEAAMFRKERIINNLVKAVVISEAIFSAVLMILFLKKGGKK